MSIPLNKNKTKISDLPKHKNNYSNSFTAEYAMLWSVWTELLE